MGLSFGASTGGTNQSSTANSSDSKVFSPGQANLQSQIGSNLSSDLAAEATGGLSPGVQAQETASADAINKTSDGLTSRVQKYLSQRGFGSSGESGKVTLASELGRQSNLATNQTNFAGVQQNVNGANLLASLNYALTNLGTTAAGSSSGDTSSWGVGAGASFGVKPPSIFG